jgi:GntR family transcriptional regulator of vanillate catabolism
MPQIRVIECVIGPNCIQPMSKRQSSVTVRLREMILNGTFAAGEHIAEAQLAKALGVSRTPVRLALGVLEHEGLVSGAPNRGFTVRGFSLQDISDAIDLRGTLEGMAARLVAEHGLTRRTAAELRACLAQGEALVAKGALGKSDGAAYEAMNVRFHAAIVEAAGNRALASAISLNEKIPFAAAGAVAFHDPSIMHRIFATAQQQHTAIVEALERGEGSRAEALMREHAFLPKKSLDLLALSGEGGAASVPALRLVRG